ncbi:hypothetical protein L484_026580 [Morus notabilis]|uniref:Uncharacterized protein n=1 Tax=Morus notabilis TaxID=981085 RepID=W9SCP5_9ROSA|nr:hypothetical protein L484_026580 [Morus notabilis]
MVHGLDMSQVTKPFNPSTEMWQFSDLARERLHDDGMAARQHEIEHGPIVQWFCEQGSQHD